MVQRIIAMPLNSMSMSLHMFQVTFMKYAQIWHIIKNNLLYVDNETNMLTRAPPQFFMPVWVSYTSRGESRPRDRYEN
jgi:isocitrate/isopropylmalate dehydrogenase